MCQSTISRINLTFNVPDIKKEGREEEEEEEEEEEKEKELANKQDENWTKRLNKLGILTLKGTEIVAVLVFFSLASH